MPHSGFILKCGETNNLIRQVVSNLDCDLSFPVQLNIKKLKSKTDLTPLTSGVSVKLSGAIQPMRLVLKNKVRCIKIQKIYVECFVFFTVK